MADTIVVKKPKTGAKKSKGHKGKRQGHNRDTGKYVKQAVRTSTNKARRIAKAKARGDKAAGTSLTQADYKQRKNV
jgi:hypothetical protein